MKQQTIYENDDICVTTTEHSYDFIAIIENKCYCDIGIIVADECGEYDNDNEFMIEPNSYIGVLADEDGRHTLAMIEQGKFRYGAIIPF